MRKIILKMEYFINSMIYQMLKFFQKNNLLSRDDSKTFSDGPLENLWGRGEVLKRYSRKGKLNEKNSCTPINWKK